MCRQNVDRQNVDGQNVDKHNVKETKCRTDNMSTDKMSTDKKSTDIMSNRHNVDKKEKKSLANWIFPWTFFISKVVKSIFRFLVF